ncbi:hypothetical protein FGO68_gene7129 [Halteria grandinella]|uniref:Uncharacterized protein n=1 Tax=Halteria grandinella TaxID=5974 RepID=A0A8J8SXA2_HALGN|nr:hypothetical protein FGO68_gene7129 [Halteria grandinella]
MIIGALMYSSPILIFVFLVRRQRRVTKRIFKARFGSLYEGLRINCLMSILSNFFFTSRRLLLIIITVFWTEYPAFQVMIYIFFSQLNIMYLIHYKPYESPETNKGEIFNEACVLAAGYHLFIFTDFVDSIDIKETGGMGIVVVILANFGINILLQLWETMKKIPSMCRRVRNYCMTKEVQVTKKEETQVVLESAQETVEAFQLKKKINKDSTTKYLTSDQFRFKTPGLNLWAPTTFAEMYPENETESNKVKINAKLQKRKKLKSFVKSKLSSPQKSIISLKQNLPLQDMPKLYSPEFTRNNSQQPSSTISPSHRHDFSSSKSLISMARIEPLSIATIMSRSQINGTSTMVSNGETQSTFNRLTILNSGFLQIERNINPQEDDDYNVKPYQAPTFD